MIAPLQLLQHAARAHAQRSGDIRHDLVLFVTLLRAVGVQASTSSSLAALQSLVTIRIERSDDFRSALGCCLTHSVEERSVFDTVYDMFWAVDLFTAPAPEPQEPTGGNVGDEVRTSGDPSAPDNETPPQDQQAGHDRATARAAYSSAPAVKDRSLVARQLRDIDALARRLARALGSAPERQLVTGHANGSVDLRATMRENLRFGDEIIELRHAHPRQDRARLVVLCDVSSSMRPYAALFLAFVHSLTRLVRRTETAVFNVEVSLATDVFRRAELRQTLAELRRREIALSGGTRIGHCLHDFLDEVEPRGALRPKTTAFILSDGWDVGEASLLEAGMRRLRDQVGRVVWCDPHAAATGYRPQVQGLRVALPYVDDYLDFRNLSSLAELVSRLESPAPRWRPDKFMSLRNYS